MVYNFKDNRKILIKNAKIEISENMPIKKRLPWKHQVASTKKCHTKLLPNKFWEKSLSVGGVCFNIKKVINIQS